jgi:transcriptional regulator with XRE-family HTH domain
MGKVNEVFAERIKLLRESKGLGVRELANILGISHSSISMYENCKREPTVSICKLFADYFNVSCDYLLGLTDERYK